MVGGFGAGSDITWDLMGAIGYDLTERVVLVGGYRPLCVDYERGDFLFDVVQHGSLRCPHQYLNDGGGGWSNRGFSTATFA